MSTVKPLLEMKDIVKSFFGVRVLDQVSVDLYTGEVLALLGENGAGKSTLIKILNGDYQKDSGTILLNGQAMQFNEPRDAEQHGISMIYQELHYAPDLTVAENLLLGHLPHRSAPLSFVVDWTEVQRKAKGYLALLKVNISPRALMRDLSVVEREIVEIVKALVIKAQIIVMDEPTAALTPREVDLLFDIIRSLRDQGVAIIYISHRLDEIPRIADRVAVLRDGKHVGTRLMRETSQREIVKMMVGREVDEESKHGVQAEKSQKPVVLSVMGLTQTGAFHDIDLEVRQGEILGIFGLLGAGHTHLTRTIFGAEKIDSGTIAIEGKPVHIHSPRNARKAGIGFVPIDRKVQGLVLDMNVRENITLSNWNGVSRMGFFRGGEERTRAGGWIDRLGIRMAGGMETRIRYLSGGNQQKVVLARWLEANVKVLLLNEPTWGVDVGARADIYQQIEALAAQGLALLVVSSDIQEVLSVSHRILTMHKGRITEEFSHGEATQENLLHAAAGGET